MNPISTEAIIQAIQQAMAHEETAEGVSFRELQKATGWGHMRIREGLETLRDEGKLEVEWVRRTNITGHPKRVPLYRIKP